MTEPDPRSPAPQPGARRGADHTLGRFLAVGVSNFVISYTTYRLLVWALDGFAAAALVGQVAAYALGTAWSFHWNRAWTFRAADGALTSQAARFLTLQLAMLASSSGALHVAVDRAGLQPTISWFAVMSVVTVLNYLGTKRWVFAEPVRSEGGTSDA